MIANDRIIMHAIKRRPRYMRPPYGDVTKHSVDVLHSMGYRVTNWSADTKDAEEKSLSRSVAEYRRVLRQVKQGRVIMLNHDTVKSTSLVLMARVAGWIRQRGWKMVTVAECMGDARGAYFPV